MNTMAVRDFAQILECADQLWAAADSMEKAGMELEKRIYASRTRQRWRIFSRKPEDHLSELVRGRQDIVRHFRNQSLYLKECVRRYRGAQVRANIRSQRVGR